MMYLRCKTRIASLLVIMAVCVASVAFAETDEGSKALIRAADRCRANEVKDLLDQGVYVNTYAFGDTALHAASQSGCEDVVYLLLTKGANIYSKNHDGNTPLALAIQNGRSEVVKLLRRYEEREKM